MRIEKPRITTLAIPCLVFLAILINCSNGRSEGRQQRLDTFKQALPEDIRLAFDSIEDPTDCNREGQMLTEARAMDPGLDAKLDSIMHAELVDSFTDTELIRFFWYYFAEAIRTGTVPDP